jgi:hypothetical protein
MDGNQDSSQGRLCENLGRQSPVMGKPKANRVAGERLLSLIEAAAGIERGLQMPRGLPAAIGRKLKLDASQLSRLWDSGKTASCGADTVDKAVKRTGVARAYFTDRALRSPHYRDHLGGRPDPFPPGWFEREKELDLDDDDDEDEDVPRVPASPFLESAPTDASPPTNGLAGGVALGFSFAEYTRLIESLDDRDARALIAYLDTTKEHRLVTMEDLKQYLAALGAPSNKPPSNHPPTRHLPSGGSRGATRRR